MGSICGSRYVVVWVGWKVCSSLGSFERLIRSYNRSSKNGLRTFSETRDVRGLLHGVKKRREKKKQESRVAAYLGKVTAINLPDRGRPLGLNWTLVATCLTRHVMPLLNQSDKIVFGYVSCWDIQLTYVTQVASVLRQYAR